jgi:threonine dehydrogenase-like Zn-dependent dehydrogenase
LGELGLTFDPRLTLGTRVLSPMRLRRIDVPEPFGPDWVRVEPRFTGICGSDVTQASMNADADNPLSALVSFPHVMGHEIVGTAGGGWVAIDPWLGCRARGRRFCDPCENGFPARCDHLGEPVVEGSTGTGLHLGNVRGLPGGFGTLMLAHVSQCRPLPGGLAPEAAVLADPLAVALHAVERARPRRDGLVLVLGAGTIGLCAVALLRRLHPNVAVLASAAWRHLADEVRALGADPVPIDSQSIVAAVGGRTGGRQVRPWLGPPWLAAGGADAVIDAVGSAGTAEIALRAVRPGGTVVRVGVGRAARVQAALHHVKEVHVVGCSGYPGGGLDRALELLRAGAVPASRWVTHSFPLARWRRAFQTAAHPRQTGSIKVVLRPR